MVVVKKDADPGSLNKISGIVLFWKFPGHPLYVRVWVCVVFPLDWSDLELKVYNKTSPVITINGV